MIEKVTLQMSGNGKFRTENGTGCDAMNPKTLMLYAAAQCSAQTALMIMQMASPTSPKPKTLATK